MSKGQFLKVLTAAIAGLIGVIALSMSLFTGLWAASVLSDDSYRITMNALGEPYAVQGAIAISVVFLGAAAGSAFVIYKLFQTNKRTR